MRDWKVLYTTGALAALGVLLLMPVQMLVFLAFPLPDTVADWFALFQHNALVGLLDMDILLIVDYVLMALIFLALWAAVHDLSPSLAALALMLEFLGLAAYFASTTALEMLALSRAYAVAASDGERIALAAAGQALLATWEGTAFTFSYVLSAVAVLLAGVTMLKSVRFTKAGGYAAIAVGVLSLIPANAGTLGLVFSVLALVPTAIWLAFIARDFSRAAAEHTTGAVTS